LEGELTAASRPLWVVSYKIMEAFYAIGFTHIKIIAKKIAAA
jgi:hypothetical protein